MAAGEDPVREARASVLRGMGLTLAAAPSAVRLRPQISGYVGQVMSKRREVRVGHGVDHGVHAGVGAGALVVAVLPQRAQQLYRSA